MIKVGWKTSEFWLSVGVSVGLIATVLEALSKSDVVTQHPIWAAVITGTLTIILGVQSAAYTIGRSMVKSAASKAEAPAQG